MHHVLQRACRRRRGSSRQGYVIAAFNPDVQVAFTAEVAAAGTTLRSDATEVMVYERFDEDESE